MNQGWTGTRAGCTIPAGHRAQGEKVQLTEVSWVAAVTERDMDILILEELHVSEPFRAWLARRLYPDVEEIEFLGAWHSLREAKLGETDLLFAFKDAEGRTRACFLEDKIDATFSPRQAQRYALRRDRLVAAGKCDVAITCLVAPQSYIDAHPEDVAIFEAAVAYEEIRDQVAAEGTIRARYRANFIREAIEQNRRGYVATPDHDVTAFWRSYYVMCQQRTPELKMKPPGKVKPASASFFQFIDCLPKGVRIVHKIRFDAVDLQVAGTDVRVLAKHIRDDRLEEGMGFLQTQKSASIRIKVPHIVLADPFGPQADAVAQALDTAARLLRFYEQHAQAFFPVINGASDDED
jgi:hypothetical protein